MQSSTIKASKSFKKMTLKAVVSIILFLVVYLVLVVLSIAITVLCGYLGIMLIIFKPAFITLMLGAGLISMGVLILIFLLKFVTKEHKTDNSHLIEITEEDEPALFNMITEIVSEVKTSFPKRIFLSADVNAAVFYDSSFWSMFFPVKKNLLIGMGLVNAVSTEELKAILSHEFGHFSQKTMKVGSYVYNVNQVIHNLLYENDSYDSLAQSWANSSGYIAFFVSIAIRIVYGIQWVLRKVYAVVNLSYMGLSREMEFHADEVAANVTGSKPLITSLLRLNLMEHAYNSVLNYYKKKIEESVKTENIYAKQKFVITFLGKDSELPFEGEFPQVTTEYLSRYNKSKLVIKDQWASHPSIDDRIKALKKLNIQEKNTDERAAISVFAKAEEWQAKISQKMFSRVTYPNPVTVESDGAFENTFEKEHKESSFHTIYNGYYDNKSPGVVDIENIGETSLDQNNKQIKEVFSSEATDMIYSSIALENDIAILEQINRGEAHIKTYDYDGRKYSFKDTAHLLSGLKKDLEKITASINQKDNEIYHYFYSLSLKKGKAKEFTEKYLAFKQFEEQQKPMFDAYVDMINATKFIHFTTPVKTIEENIYALKKVENAFKEQIRLIIKDEVYLPELTIEMKDHLEKYLSKTWTYFRIPDYDNNALEIMFASMHYVNHLISKVYFQQKKKLLDFQVQLEIE